jgi:phospholipid/cholesterol/gamma-HCH transport system substrate-binding protein
MMALRAGLRRFRAPFFLIAATIAGIIGFRMLGSLAEYRLQVALDSADGLYPGSDVLVAGSRAGTVRDVKADGGQALVTIALDRAHSPVHANARITVRPKSLLGEKYLALQPGTADTLASGSTLPHTGASLAVDLQDVVNIFDQPTREKLRTLIKELGGGLAGRGLDTNQTISYGRQDLDDLAALADTLKARDQDLEQVILALEQVTAELSKSDRRQQLGGFIHNSEVLLHSLAQQDAQIKKALVETNAALSRTDTALNSAGADLNAIFRQTPQLVHLANALGQDLGNGMDHHLAGDHPRWFDRGMKLGPIIFGAHDGNGYATRVTVIVGPGTSGVPTGFPGLKPGGASAFDSVLDVLLGEALK